MFIFFVFVNTIFTIIIIYKVFNDVFFSFFPLLLWLLTEYVVLQISPLLLTTIFHLQIHDNILIARSLFYFIFICLTYFVVLLFIRKKIVFKFNFNSYKGSLSSLLIFWISLLIFFFYIFLGGISARELYGNVIESSNFFYYVRGFFDIFYFLTFILGYKADKKSFLIFAFFCFVMILGEHRGQLLSFVISYFFGRLIYMYENNIKFKFDFKIFISIGGLILVFLFTTQNRLNSSQQFRQSAILMSFDRFYEPTIDRVIEYSNNRNNHFFYFENFERILTMPFPAFILKSKKNNDDSNENLEKYYGYNTSVTHWPIPFLADSYRRFSYWGVFLFSFIAMYALQSVFVFCLTKSVDYILISSFIVAFSFRIYSFSVLGLISFFIFMIPKMYLLLIFNKKIIT